MSFAIVAIPNSTAWPLLENKEGLKKAFHQALQFPLDQKEIPFGRTEILDKLDALGFTDQDVRSKSNELQAVSRKQIVFYVTGLNAFK